MKKKCGTCKEDKSLNEYFCAPSDGAARLTGTSRHCIGCHNKGLVKHGYGWYGDLYRIPSWLSQ